MKLALNMFAPFCFHVYLLLTSVTVQNWEQRYLLSTEKTTHSSSPAGQRLLKANVNVRSSKSKRLKLRSRARLRLLSARRAPLCLLAQNFEINKTGAILWKKSLFIFHLITYRDQARPVLHWWSLFWQSEHDEFVWFEIELSNQSWYGRLCWFCKFT